MLAAFSCSVTLSGGRTVEVQPRLHVVRSIVACVTCGFNAPGVQRGSWRESSPDPIAWHEPGARCGCAMSLLTVEYTTETEWQLEGGGRRLGGEGAGVV